MITKNLRKNSAAVLMAAAMGLGINPGVQAGDALTQMVPAGQRWFVIPTSVGISVYDDPRFGSAECEQFEADLTTFFSKFSRQIADCSKGNGSGSDPMCQFIVRRINTLRYDGVAPDTGNPQITGGFYFQNHVLIQKDSLNWATQARAAQLSPYRVVPAQQLQLQASRGLELKAIPDKGSWIEKILAIPGTTVAAPISDAANPLAFRLVGREEVCDLREGRVAVRGSMDVNAQIDSTDKTAQNYWNIRENLQTVLDRNDLDSLQKAALAGLRVAEGMPAVRSGDAETSSETILFDILRGLTADNVLRLKEYSPENGGTLQDAFSATEFPISVVSRDLPFQAQWAAGVGR